ncbi:hypothetical protein FQR65_LT18621 [Abscondita terminalis]|nr:hypothetical protein FQR65_LT18621 [Abscondita terminalis]
MKAQSPEQYAGWIKMRKGIEYRIMARQFFANVTAGVTANNKEAAEILRERDQLANIDYVKIDYAAYLYLKKHPLMFKADPRVEICIGIIVLWPQPSVDMGAGLESFQNTKNDSMFVTVNSDVPFNPQFLALTQQPEEIRSFLSGAASYENGKQEAGLADPESVRSEIEPIKATSLDQIAKLFGSAKESSQINILNPALGGSIEPKVAGAAFGVKANQLSNPVEGTSGVYVVVKKSVVENKQGGDAKSIAQALMQQGSQMYGQALLKSLQDKADIKDYRIEIYNKAAAGQH